MNSAGLRPGVAMAGTVTPGSRSPTTTPYCSSESRQMRAAVVGAQSLAEDPGGLGPETTGGAPPGEPAPPPEPDESSRLSSRVPVQPNPRLRARSGVTKLRYIVGVLPCRDVSPTSF